MTHVVRIHENGGPEVLAYETVECGDPGPGQARIRQEAIGLNFIDVYYRTGLYPPPGGLPLIPGSEGAGTVVAVGQGVTGLRVGDRVAYAMSLGAYAQERLIAADRLVKLPDAISFETAAGMMLKGMTAEYLLHSTFQVKPGHTILLHAAAGGVGLIAGRWARHLGATVIGTAGSPEKVALALANGCDHVINYRTEDFVARVREITGGRGVEVVYDSVGKDTIDGSLDCLKPRGLLVLFGQSSGAVPPFNLGLLAQKGSLYITRPMLGAYIATRAELEQSAGRLFDAVEKGIVKIEVKQSYPLERAGDAHRDLQGRKTTGTTVLIP